MADILGIMTESSHRPSLDELDALSTEELRERAFALARRQRDIQFFWSILQRLPDADEAAMLDGAPNTLGPTIDEAVALWRQMTGHAYDGHEPLLRAAFIEYLRSHGERE